MTSVIGRREGQIGKATEHAQYHGQQSRAMLGQATARRKSHLRQPCLQQLGCLLVVMIECALYCALGYESTLYQSERLTLQEMPMTAVALKPCAKGSFSGAVTKGCAGLAPPAAAAGTWCFCSTGLCSQSYRQIRCIKGFRQIA